MLSTWADEKGMRGQRVWLWIVVLLFLSPLLAWSSLAGRTVPLPKDLRADAREGERIFPKMEAIGVPISLGGNSSSLPPAYRECTRIAYQSWVGNNWEIYIARGDGSERTRLTHAPDQDEAPSLAEGCQLIAFSSKRNGNSDIYTMYSDGSHLERITTDPARDVLPALSPDGQKIAFQSYRDGDEPEVYVIDLPSGELQRLTYYGGYDGQPAWSPDGSKIAFISDRSGAKNVWVMDADGSHLRQITALPYTGGPKWSPDGQRIAFACDDQGTGFSSLWVVNVDGSGAHLLWRPSEERTDVWPGGWSYDGRYIVYEQATWRYEEGWYITRSHLDIIAPEAPAERYRLVEGGIHMAASWALCDLVSPSSAVNALPPISSSPLLVSWEGEDDCSTALEYHVQYRVGGTASWIDWQIVPGELWTQATRGFFYWEQPGTVVYFRSQARDLVGHVEPWDDQIGDTRTSFPAQIEGYVRDCRGLPVAGATLDGPPPLSQRTWAEVNGHYLLLASSEGERGLTVEAEGFRKMILDRPALDHMQGIDHYLLTEEELLENGSFESGQAGWFAQGRVSFPRVSYAYGERCAQLGQSSFPSPLPGGSIFQVFRLSSQVPHPTFSYLYAVGDGSADEVGTLEVLLQAADGSTTVLHRTNAPTPWGRLGGGESYPLWQHAWADLSPWVGQVVTLTLRYDPQQTKTWALVEQVSASSWLTPQIERVYPRSAIPGQEATITIYGTNLSGGEVSLMNVPLATTCVNDHVLQASVPATLPVGVYDVWVSNGWGYRGVLQRGFSVGTYLPLPFICKGWEGAPF